MKAETMLHLSAGELRVLHRIITENLGDGSPVLKQIPELRFSLRHLTGTGFYIEFEPIPAALRAIDIDAAISVTIPTKFPPPQELAGFTLFIDNGVITSFEGYMFGDVAWPAQPIDDWVLFENSVTADEITRS